MTALKFNVYVIRYFFGYPLCQPRIIRTSVLRRVFRLILCSATVIYGCIMPFARRVLAKKRAAILAGNQNVAIFDDFCRRRLCSYLLYGRRRIRHKARKYRRFGGVRIILGWHRKCSHSAYMKRNSKNPSHSAEKI